MRRLPGWNNPEKMASRNLSTVSRCTVRGEIRKFKSGGIDNVSWAFESQTEAAYATPWKFDSRIARLSNLKIARMSDNRLDATPVYMILLRETGSGGEDHGHGGGHTFRPHHLATHRHWPHHLERAREGQRPVDAVLPRHHLQLGGLRAVDGPTLGSVHDDCG